ncbi:hypothetical protein [Carnobacterium sp.]|uniref:hypothetical protein n=1 Tax=Carnobacterium sp. TaxID=48221 RepID=UPI003890135A
MFNQYKEFTEKHPYTHAISIMVITSFIGIAVEYQVNKKFSGGGLYTAIALTIIELLRVKKRIKSKQ